LIKKISTEYNLKIKEKDEKISQKETEFENLNKKFLEDKESKDDEVKAS